MAEAEVIVLRRPAPLDLEELARRLREPLALAGCERAVAFGSFARGEADGFSDLDLIVVVPTDLPRMERGSLVREVVRALPVAVDVVVLTPEEFNRGLERGFGIFDAVAREGVTLYERSAG